MHCMELCCWVLYLWTSVLGTQLQENIQWTYTECPGRNVPDFGRMFLTLKYTDLTENTYIWSWTVTKIMVWETCGLLVVPRTVPVPHIVTLHCACPFFSLTAKSNTFWLNLSTDVTVTVNCNSILLDILVSCKVFGTLRTTMTLVRVYVV